MRLDKRYVTDVDLRCTTSTGDPEGEPGDEHEPLAGAALERRLGELRGDVELAIPAASAVKIDGKRAYRLHREGVAVEMPLRVMRVHSLELVEVSAGIARLELHVGSGTYVRAIAEALGGHCVTLRRTAIGPFDVAEADPLRVVPLEEALGRLEPARGDEAA